MNGYPEHMQEFILRVQNTRPGRKDKTFPFMNSAEKKIFSLTGILTTEKGQSALSR